jgi:hypothetical protein
MDSGKTMVRWTAIGLVLTVCQSVEATEKYAAQTGRPCAQCHVYPTGESAGGFSQHGLARATCQGYIAGLNAAVQGGEV